MTVDGNLGGAATVTGSDESKDVLARGRVGKAHCEVAGPCC